MPPVSLCNWQQSIYGECFHAAKYQQRSLSEALSMAEANKQWVKIRAAVSTLPTHLLSNSSSIGAPLTLSPWDKFSLHYLE